jgi:hypothetical protein
VDGRPGFVDRRATVRRRTRDLPSIRRIFANSDGFSAVWRSDTLLGKFEQEALMTKIARTLRLAGLAVAALVPAGTAHAGLLSWLGGSVAYAGGKSGSAPEFDLASAWVAVAVLAIAGLVVHLRRRASRQG